MCAFSDKGESSGRQTGHLMAKVETVPDNKMDNVVIFSIIGQSTGISDKNELQYKASLLLTKQRKWI